jgi:hypothetical protein
VPLPLIIEVISAVVQTALLKAPIELATLPSGGAVL